MPDPSLFHGVAILIDDDIVDEGAGIRKIQAQIEEAGCHVVPMSQLPTDDGMPNLRGAAFFVLDWNLYGRSLRDPDGGDPIPATPMLKEQNAVAAIEFLKKLKKVCVAPVFIFTDDVIEEVEERIKEHMELYNPDDPSHILVRSKTDVTTTGVFKVLSTWMEKAPSVYVLKNWEKAYEKAKNELFLDFYHNSVHWPLVMWTTYTQDGIDESVELGNLIGRNLHSRMTPFHFDLGPFKEAIDSINSQAAKSSEVVLKVLEGERFLRKERLQADSIAPGDIFKRGSDYFINIRPDCDCIAREGVLQDEMEMYLLRANKFSAEKIAERVDKKSGTISERDTETIIFGMMDGITFCFQFKALTIEPWKNWKSRRIGRLLPPYLTRLQQRYSAYLQRPGLTKIPKVLLPLPATDTMPPVAATGPAPVAHVAAEVAPVIPPAAEAETLDPRAAEGPVECANGSGPPTA